MIVMSGCKETLLQKPIMLGKAGWFSALCRQNQNSSIMLNVRKSFGWHTFSLFYYLFCLWNLVNARLAALTMKDWKRILIDPYLEIYPHCFLYSDVIAILNSKSNSGVANIKNTHAAQEFSAIQSSHNPLRSLIFAACCRSMQCRVGHHGVSELREHPIQSGPGPGRSTGLSGLRPGGRKPTNTTC